MDTLPLLSISYPTEIDVYSMSVTETISTRRDFFKTAREAQLPL